jgi:hypothetical protein
MPQQVLLCCELANVAHMVCMLAVTLCRADTPNELTGWSPERAKAFGAAHVTALLNTVPALLMERHTKDVAAAE